MPRRFNFLEKMGCGVDKALWSWGVAFTPSLWTNLPTFVAELRTWCDGVLDGLVRVNT